MKECPICHAMNGDGSETCYNCHSSLNFSAKGEEKQIDNENSKKDNNKCVHCGADTNNINVSYTDNDIINSQAKNKILLCNKCKTKKLFLSLLFYIIAIILGFFAALLLSAFLSILFGLRPRYGVGATLIPAFLISAHAYINSIFKKPKKEKTNNNTDIRQEKVKKRFCKKCGNKLDENKKCNACGKQYFKIKKPKFNKFVCTITIFIIMILSLAGLNVYQYINHYDYIIKADEIRQELNEEIDNLNSTIKSNTQIINYWKGLYNSEKNLNDDNETVSVYDNGTNLYHKILCVDAWRMCKETDIYKKTGSISYQEYSKEEAIRLGYTPCPSCYS